MSFLESLTRSERMVIAFLVAVALIGLVYSASKKSHSEKLPRLYGGTHRTSNEKIDINSATEKMLVLLNGIGPVTASRIIEYRDENGSFTGIEDIQKVKGIGPKKFEAIREFITAGSGNGPAGAGPAE